LLVLVTLAGCGTAPAASPPASAFNSTDTAWLQLMIPMDERLVAALDLVPGRGSPPLTELAVRVSAHHRTTLVHLRQLRDEAGLPATSPHLGHEMPGMVPTADLDLLRASTGATFDAGLATRLGAHLDRSFPGRDDRSIDRGLRAGGCGLRCFNATR
jgi:hypothetical protein